MEGDSTRGVVIQANKDACAAVIDSNPMTVTAILPLVGYKRAGKLVRERESERPKRPLRGFLSERLGHEIVTKHLYPSTLTALGFTGNRETT